MFRPSLKRKWLPEGLPTQWRQKRAPSLLCVGRRRLPGLGGSHLRGSRCNRSGRGGEAPHSQQRKRELKPRVLARVRTSLSEGSAVVFKKRELKATEPL